MTGDRTQQITLRIDPETIQLARRVAAIQGISTSELLRKAWVCYSICANENLPEGMSLAIVDTRRKNKVLKLIKFAN